MQTAEHAEQQTRLKTSKKGINQTHWSLVNPIKAQSFKRVFVQNAETPVQPVPYLRIFSPKDAPFKMITLIISSLDTSEDISRYFGPKLGLEVGPSMHEI